MVHYNSLCFHLDSDSESTHSGWQTVSLLGIAWLFRLRRAAFSFAGAEMMTVWVELVVGSPERPVG